MKTIHIDAPIGSEAGEISAKAVKSQLPVDGSPIRVKFHSEGGSLFEAFAIYDAIAAYPGPKQATVEAMAFSAASLLLCAFDRVEITPNGYAMIHSPHMDGKDASPSERQLLANLRARMVKIYSAKTRKPASVIDRLIDQETFFDAEAAVSLGLVDAITRGTSMVVARLPARVLAKLRAARPATAKGRWEAAVAAKAAHMPKAKAITQVDRDHPGLRQEMIREANRR